MSYTPPIFDAADIEISFSYTAPAFDAADIDFAAAAPATQLIDASGIVSTLTIGDPVVAPGAATLRPASMVGGIGVPTVQNYTRYLSPVAIAAGGIGTPAILNTLFQITPVGFNAFKGFGFGADGAGWVSFLDRTLKPSGAVHTTYGNAAQVTLKDRFIEVPHHDATLFGLPVVTHLVRYIEPPFVPGTGYGVPTMGRHRQLEPLGMEGAIGTPDVHDNTQTAHIQSFSDAGIGTAFVSFDPRELKPQGFPSARDTLPNERWGLPEVINTRRYVTQIFDGTLPGEGGVFGDPIWMTVENRNRTMRPTGWDSAKVPRPTVENGARALLAEGADAATFGVSMVSHYIRYFPQEGIEAPGFGPWGVVYNNARLLGPAGQDMSSWGLPSIENTRRYFDHIGGFTEMAFGAETFVAERVRMMFVPLGPEGTFGTQTVYNLTSYVAPASIDHNPYVGQWGLTSVEGHRNEAFPRSILPRAVVSTEATVLNRNRAISSPDSFDFVEFGRPRVDNFIRYLVAGGDQMSAMGPLGAVEYRTKTISVPAVPPPPISVFHRAAKTTPDPPSEQKVFPNGIAPLAIERPVVRDNSIRPAGATHTTYGGATVRSNGLFPSSILGVASEEARFGDVRTNATQWINVPAQRAPDDPLSNFQKPLPRLSPFTIYATNDKPLGYTPAGFWRRVDEHLGTEFNPGWPLWGTAAVTHKNRRVYPFGSSMSATGTEAMVDLKRRYITPQGLLSFKRGIPELAPRTLEFEEIGLGAQGEFGETTVEHWIDPSIPRYLRPEGMAERYGVQRVELLNRELPVPGWDSFTMSAPAPYPGPHVYGPLSTRVHYPEPVRPPSIVGAFGTTWVSHRIRQLEVESWESFAEGFELDTLADRMRVRHGLNPPISPPSLPTTHAIGAPTVSNFVRELGPAPANKFTQFGNATAKYQAIIALGGYGFEALQMGTPAKWQAGDDVVPYGDDMAAFGTPRIDRVMHATGFDAATFGAPVVGPWVRVPGIAASEFGLPTMSYADGDEFVCGLRPRALPPQGFTSAAFGAHTVA